MQIDERKWFFTVFSLFVCLLVGPGLAGAHDLWLNLDNHCPRVGEKTSAKVVFGHNFPYYGILIKRYNLTGFSCLCPDGKMKEVENTWEDRRGEREGALAGEIIFDKEGTYIVTAYRKVKGDKEHVASEKYGKAIVVAGKGSGSVSEVLGHRIEIVPLKNPSRMKAGEDFPVRILFEGKPLSTYVYATFAGYYSEDEPFPVAVKSDEKGVAFITMNQPGVWMIVSNHKVDFSASLTLEIK